MKRIYIILLILSILFVLSGCSLFPKSQNKGNEGAISSQESSQNSENDQGTDASSTETLISKIIQAAKDGKIPNVPFIVGETDIHSIEKNWGTPKSISTTPVGIYATFDSYSTVFGYYQDSPIFDIRSYDKSLQTITFNQVEQIMGKPDSISHYKDGNIHQQILVYTVNNENKLRWVMDTPSAQNPNPKIDHISVYNQQIENNSIAAKINKMTLEEKIGQMFMVGITGTTPGADAKAMINQEHVGGLILYGENMITPNQIVDFTNALKALNRTAHNPAPLFLSVDQEGGEVDRMPRPIIKMPANATIGKSNDSNYSYQVGQILGKECSSLGFNMDYAPVLDVIAQPGKSAIGNRSFSSNATIVSQLGTSTMKGIQSQNVISVIKHFPGYGSVNTDAHVGLPTIHYGLEPLKKVDWLPYDNAIKNGADIVMVTHLLVPALNTKYPASMSPIIINDMLRKRLGFKGVVITDDMTMGAIKKNYNIQTATVKAVEAGADIVMVAFHADDQKAAIAALKQAVENGTISENRIDDSVFRILQMKQKYKLSDKAINYPDIAKLNQTIRSGLK